MNKYIHHANLENILVVGKLLHFMRSIQTQVKYDYKYYVTGSLSPDKLINFLNKIDQIYFIGESSKDRYRRYQLNQATVQIILFFPPSATEIYFILLARPGCYGSLNHIFFRAEKYKDLTLKNESLVINHYILKRVNKEQYSFYDKDGSEKIVSGKNEVWTFDLTEKYVKDVIENIRIALIRRDNKTVTQILRSFENVIPFHKVRSTYFKTAVRINERIRKFYEASNIDSSMDYIQPLKNKLSHLRASSIVKLNLEDLINNSTLKKVKQ